jgi:hypothetical protein
MAQSAWDGAYTAAQADRGAQSFARSCAGCHNLGPDGRIPLVGDNFWKSFSQKSVGDLLQYISANMPNGSPGSLNETEYRDIAAVMLRSNGFPAGVKELDRASTAEILPRDGSTALPANALARVVGCLTKSGSEWVVTRATNPERVERARTEAEEAARPLGTRTMALKFVLTKLDPLAGARVAVNGLLIGAGGADGINVTNVTRVAAGCP